MFCIMCGAENPEYAHFCRKCGHAQATISSPGSKSDRQKEVETGSSTPSVRDSAGDGARRDQPEPSPDVEQNGAVEKEDTTHLGNDEHEITPLEMENLPLGEHATVKDERQKMAVGDNPIVQASADIPFLDTLGTFPELEYATLWQRFQGYFADLIVVYLIVFGLYFLSGLLGVFGKSFLSTDKSEAGVIFYVVLFSYMVLALTIYHTTVGKYVVGIEVAAEKSAGAYPSFWRILLRETVGRLLSSFFFGVGYWGVPSDKKKQAWSDNIAKTVVRRRSVNSTLKTALAAFVLVSFIADVGLYAWGVQIQAQTTKYNAWQTELGAISTEVSASRTTANGIMNREPKTFEESQRNMNELLVTLDDYDQKLQQYREAIQRGDWENLTTSDEGRNEIRVLLQVADLRKQQSDKQRHEAMLILNFRPNVSSMTDLQSELRMIDSDVSGLDHQASQLLSGIGIK